VSKEFREGPGYGTIEDHISIAVSSVQVSLCFLCSPLPQCPKGENPKTRSRWIIPLCGGLPKHWVLGWVDFKLKKIAIFDSLPACKSERWARPVSPNIVHFEHF